MSIEIKVPALPESVSEATVATWHKKEGDSVSRDENLVDLETDKVVLEVPAPADGVLGPIQAGDGATVQAEQVIASLEEGAGGGAAPESDQAAESAAPAAGSDDGAGEARAAEAASGGEDALEIRVPGLPESVSEATVGAWHKKEGDPVSRDENLVDLETDKVVLEVPAPADGTLGPVRVAAGETVTADQVVALLYAGGPAASGKATSAAAEPAAESAPAAAPASAGSGGRSSGGAANVDPGELSPAVRHLVLSHDLDPSAISGTGPGGRLTKEDVVAHIEGGGRSGPTDEPSQPPTPPARDPGREAKEAAPEPTSGGASGAAPVAGDRTERRVPMTRLRQRIAERLVEAQQTAAMLTTFNEVNMKPVMDLRARHKERFQETHGVKLGFMSFFVKAACEALRRYPALNASIDGTDILYHGYQDVGIAVSSERGLVVPVLRNAEQQGFADIESNIVDFGKRAAAGKLSMDDLTGGTFSITNGGIFGSLLSTPILNPPQSGILGMHKTQERPLVENGEVVVRPMMYLALSYDHRIVDGKEAVGFLVTIKECIEDPARLLLEV